MLSATATLIAAITGHSRRPIARVLVDWADASSSAYDDVSDAVTAVTVDRAITTDLPPSTQMVSGGSAAAATLELAGTVGSQLTGRLLSPFLGLLGGNRRLNSPVTVELGMVGTAGAEYVPQFKGRIRDNSGSSSKVEVSLSANDGAELLPVKVTLPPIPNLDPGQPTISPGLDSVYVMDYVARRNGFYVTPPQRARCQLSVPLQGSTYPEAGSIVQSFRYVASGYQGGPKFTTIAGRRYGLVGLNVISPFAQMSWKMAGGGTSLNEGQSTFLEFYGYSLTNGGVFDTEIISITNNADESSGTAGISVSHRFDDKVFVSIQRGGVSAVFQTPAGALNENVHYFAVHVQATTQGADVRVRIDGATYTGNVVVGSPTGQPVLEYVHVYGDGGYAGLQVTTEELTGLTYNNGFATTSSFDAPQSELVAMPPVEDAQPWQVLVDVAEAEGGAILFDESGVLRFYNAARLGSTTSTAVATIGADRALIALSMTEAIDAVRNTVRVPSNPPKVDQDNAIIWTASEILTVNANSRMVVYAAFEGTAVSLDTSMAYFSGATDASAGSGYRAARNADGTGGDVSNLVFTVYRYPGRAMIAIDNPNAYPVSLVGNSLSGGDAGQAMLQLVGRLARVEDNHRYTATVSDASSAELWGEQSIDVQDTPWRQSNAQADLLAATLLARLKDPHPVITGLSAVGDPRLQLSDVVTVIDVDGAGVVRDFRIVGINRRFDNSGMTDTYQVREVGPATSGMVGNWTLDGGEASRLDSVYGIA